MYFHPLILASYLVVAALGFTHIDVAYSAENPGSRMQQAQDQEYINYQDLLHALTISARMKLQRISPYEN